MIEAVIFDLDGVIVSTDEFHYQAWKKLSDEEGIYFDRHINERLRGVSRLESLDIIMEKATKNYTEDEKKALRNFEQLRISVLNGIKDDGQFHLTYRKFQVLANLNSWKDFLNL